MAKINETNYPRRQASEYAPTDMLILQPDGEDTATTRVSDLKDYMGLDEKVDKVTGKGLSTEDYTTVEKEKLSGINIFTEYLKRQVAYSDLPAEP